MGQAIQNFNSDLSKRVVVNTTEMDWQASPSPGVWRKRLELLGGVESGQVTSVVRYAPGSAFSRHEHPEGEEILVLAGTFSDHTGDYPAGSYLLNPEGFSHAPFSKEGCTLFVKLRQYAGLERHSVRLNTAELPWIASSVTGVEIKSLYTQEGFPEKVQLERWYPGTTVERHTHSDVEEIFVLEGRFADENGVYSAGTWLRNPPESSYTPISYEGCVLYVRTAEFKSR